MKNKSEGKINFQKDQSEQEGSNLEELGKKMDNCSEGIEILKKGINDFIADKEGKIKMKKSSSEFLELEHNLKKLEELEWQILDLDFSSSDYKFLNERLDGFIDDIHFIAERVEKIAGDNEEVIVGTPLNFGRPLVKKNEVDGDLEDKIKNGEAEEVNKDEDDVVDLDEISKDGSLEEGGQVKKEGMIKINLLGHDFEQKKGWFGKVKEIAKSPEIWKQGAKTIGATVASVVGIKSFHDVPAYFNQLRKASGKKKEYKNLFADLDNKELSDEQKENEDLKVAEMIDLDKMEEIENKISEMDASEQIKDKLLEELNYLFENYKEEFESLSDKSNEKLKDSLDYYITTKISKIQALKEVANTVLVAGDAMGLRAMVYGGSSVAERYFKQKKEAYLNDREFSATKDVFVGGVSETFKGVTLQSEGNRVQKGLKFIKSAGSLLRFAGISASDLDGFDSQQEAIDKLIDNVSSKDFGVDEIQDNVISHVQKVTHLGGKETGEEAPEKNYSSGKIKISRDTSSEVQPLSGSDNAVASNVGVEVDDKKILSDAPVHKTSEALQGKEEVTETPPADPIPTFDTKEIIRGDSVWTVSEKYLDNRLGEKFESLGGENEQLAEALRVYNADKLKDEIINNPEKYGLPSDTDINKLTLKNLRGIDWDKAYNEVFKDGDMLDSLNEEQVEKIIKNNQKLFDYFQDNPDAPRTEANFEAILNDSGEAKTGVIEIKKPKVFDEAPAEGSAKTIEEVSVELSESDVSSIEGKINQKIDDIYNFSNYPHDNIEAQVDYSGVQPESWNDIKDKLAKDVLDGKFDGAANYQYEDETRHQIQEYLESLVNETGLNPEDNETLEDFIKRSETENYLGAKQELEDVVSSTSGEVVEDAEEVDVKTGDNAAADSSETTNQESATVINVGGNDKEFKNWGEFNSYLEKQAYYDSLSARDKIELKGSYDLLSSDQKDIAEKEIKGIIEKAQKSLEVNSSIQADSSVTEGGTNTDTSTISTPKEEQVVNKKAVTLDLEVKNNEEIIHSLENLNLSSDVKTDLNEIIVYAEAKDEGIEELVGWIKSNEQGSKKFLKYAASILEKNAEENTEWYNRNLETIQSIKKGETNKMEGFVSLYDDLAKKIKST